MTEVNESNVRLVYCLYEKILNQFNIADMLCIS